MECYIVFNWAQLWKDEIEALGAAALETNSPAEREQLLARLDHVTMFGPTGHPRHEHLLRASEIRWPTVKDANGVWQGVAKRHEWPERIFAQALDPSWVTPPVVGVFGGGSQGKTTMISALMLHVFSHFEGTLEGAQCIISTINEDKMNLATWPALTRMLEQSAPGISLYAGQEQSRSDNFIGRRAIQNGTRTDKQDPGNSLISGVLLGVHGKRTGLGDKLTGAHGKKAKVLLIDEAQSSSDAPFTIITNAFASVPQGRRFFFYSGNFATKHDTLGKNICPVGGWASLDGPTPVYHARTQGGLPARIIHLNNMESPGMKDPEFFHELFTPQKLAEQVPDEYARNNPAVQRMITGWYDVEATRQDARNEETVVADSEEMERVGAFSHVTIEAETRQVFTMLDAAPEMKDRNVIAMFEHGWDGSRNVYQPVAYSEMPRMERNADMARDYPEAFAGWVKDFLTQQGANPETTVNTIDSAHFAMFAPVFHEHGLILERMVYAATPGNPKMPKADNYGEVEPAFDVADNMPGYLVAQDRISLGAWLFRKFYQCGTAKGHDPATIRAGAVTYFDAEQELFRRTIYRVNNQQRGSLWKLGRKTFSDDGKAASPDWQDLWFMAAYYVAKRFGEVPGRPTDRQVVHAVNSQPRIDDPFAMWESLTPELSVDQILRSGAL
jgi:hypothetical protein